MTTRAAYLSLFWTQILIKPCAKDETNETKIGNTAEVIKKRENVYIYFFLNTVGVIKIYIYILLTVEFTAIYICSRACPYCSGQWGKNTNFFHELR